MDDAKKKQILMKALGLLSMVASGTIPPNIAAQANESFDELGELFFEMFPDSKRND